MSNDGSDRGMVPAQWFVRLLGLSVAGLVAAAVVGSLDDIKRYAHIKRM